MDNRHGRGDGAPPQRSPDGSWWWDGREWQPTQRRPAAGGGGIALLRRVPGFRSGAGWKAVVACLFYASCLVGLLAGVGSGSWWAAGIYASTLATGLFSALLLQYLRRRPINLVMAGGLIVALSTCGVSLANGPSARSASPTPGPSGSAVAALPASPTAQPTATAPPPTSTPTPTQVPTPTARPPAATPAPTAVPTRPPTVATPPTAAPPPACKADAPSNPWGYDFCPGSVITAVPSNACSYFNCIKSFWNQTNGHFEECADGTYSN